MANGATMDPTLLGSLRWRCIGPPRGGRTVAVAGDPDDLPVFYFGACGGGVWKTADAGTYWENVSDGYFNTAAVGAIAVAESDPNVVYAGTGEACIRGNVAHGDGVYRSTDAGKSWTNVGLRDTRHIGRVRIHPANPDLVYVAALGHAYGPNQERGVFRSKDGGGAWEQVLFRSKRAGAVDLSMDPNNPRILYATIWQALRQPWHFSSGGPDCGLFRSTDGGDTWEEITRNEGLPEGLLGRMGVAASPAQSGRVWALIEAEEGGLFRSDDGGDKWERVSDDANLVQRPWYYSHVFADPEDADTAYVLNLKMWKSTDGGRNFDQVTTPHGDNHDLWIDPQNPKRMIEGNDGGACVSLNGGETWSTIYNQLTSQFYHVTTDTQFPYRVYGTQQDNSAISVPSSSYKGAILWSDCYAVGSSESGHIAVRPDDPNIVYSGAIGSSPGGGDSLLRYDHATGQTRIISAWPEFSWGWGPKDHRYRFQWTYPIVISPHDPNVLYIAGNVLFRSEDEGASWEVISEDLTKGDERKMEASGGPITLDTTYVEHYGTIFALTESPHQRGVLWAGTDDGLVHLSRDGGKTWEDVTPSALPEGTRIDVIELSPHEADAAYISATRYKFDDNRPFLLKTNDSGKSWTQITDGIPNDDFTRMIREDPERRGLLYAGTESGAYISFDDGGSWQSMQLNLPTVPVTDLEVRGDELVVSTNGRSFWILNGLTVLRQLAAEVRKKPAHLFKPADAYRIAPTMGAARQSGPNKNYMLSLGYSGGFRDVEAPGGVTERIMLDSGSNPPEGVVVSYIVGKQPEGEVTLAFLDAEGRPIKRFGSTPSEEPESKDEPRQPWVLTEPGMNRFVWDMRYPDATRIEGDGAKDNLLRGPLAPPGAYQVQLTVDGLTQTQTFELLIDPKVSASTEDLEAQFDLLLRIRDKVSETHDAVSRVRGVRRQVDEWVERSKGRSGSEVVVEAADSLNGKLSAVEEELIQLKVSGDLGRISQPAKINAKLAALESVPASADFAPTKQSRQVFESLSAEADAQLEVLQETLDNELSAFINVINELGIPALVAD